MSFIGLIEKSDELDQKIYNLTRPTELLTIEWIFKAIEKVHGNIEEIHTETKRRLDKRYGTAYSRDKTYALPGVQKDVIDDLVGENIYNVGLYYMHRGVSRTSRADTVTKDVEKDYNAKRNQLKNKILKLANNEKITEFSHVSTEQDGKLGCYATLESGDIIQIYSIQAGGWNIQKFHFRGLAKRFKGHK